MEMRASATARLFRAWVAACAVAALPAGVGAADFYAATTGTPAANGSFANPWDLRTALAHPAAVQPGDTIWVRGGRYTGPFTSRLQGTSAAPITVRNYDGERVVLEASVWNCDPLLTDRCSGFLDPCTCSLSDPRCPNSRGTPLTIAPCSHDVWIWGIETVNNDPSRWTGPPGGCSDAPECCYPGGDFNQPLLPECDQTPQSAALSSHTVLDAITVYGDNVKMINCVFHDGGVGIAWWEPAGGTSETYGSMIFNNGWMNPSRGNGHGFYTQNFQTTDLASRKLIRDTLTWNNFGWGVHARGGCGRVQGFTMEGNVSFGNGMPKAAFFALDPVLFVDSLNSAFPNYFFESAPPMRDMVVRNNYSYSPVGTGNFYSNALRIGAENHFNVDVAIEDNYFVGDGIPFYIENWALAKVTGNTLVGGGDNNVGNATEEIVRYVDARTMAHLGEYVWDDNHYFMTGTNPTPFRLWRKNWGASSMLNFADWKTTTGVDSNSTYAVGLPAVNQVAVRPNEYEPGRAHIVIYNWQDLASVPVDLSGAGLTEGQSFKIHNVQSFKVEDGPDWFGNVVASGTYSSAAPIVNVSMTDLAVTQPIGFLQTQTTVFGATNPVPPTKPASFTNLLFGVFLLRGGV